MAISTADLVKLPTEEKLALIETLWDSLNVAEVPMPDWHRDVLNAREAEDAEVEDAEVEDATDEGDSWEAVKARLLAQK